MLAAFFFILVMTIGAGAISYQGDALGHTYDIESETVSASGATFSGGEVVTLENSNIDDAVYDDNSAIDVFDDQSVEMVEGEDYEWNENNGTITVLAGGGLTDSADMDVNYSFHIPNQQQKDVLTIVGGQLTVGKGLMYVFGAVIAIAFVRIFAGMG